MRCRAQHILRRSLLTSAEARKPSPRDEDRRRRLQAKALKKLRQGRGLDGKKLQTTRVVAPRDKRHASQAAQDVLVEQLKMIGRVDPRTGKKFGSEVVRDYTHPKERELYREVQTMDPDGSLMTPVRVKRAKDMSQAAQLKRQQNKVMRQAADHGRGGRWKQALELIDYCREIQIPMTVFMYSAILKALSQSMRWRESLEVLEAMAADPATKPNAFCYSSVMTAYGRAGKWEQAVDLLEQMRDEGVEPNLVAYNAAIGACSKGGARRALRLMQQMRDRGLEPDVITYNSAMSACDKQGLYSELDRLMEEMQEQRIAPNMYSYNTMMSSLSRRKRWEAALQLMEDMEAAGCPPDCYTYCAAISACGRSGMWRRSLELLKGMADSGVPADTSCYCAAIDAAGRAKQVRVALSLVEDMTDRSMQPHPAVYTAVMTACTRSAKWAELLALCDRLAINSIQPNREQLLLALGASFEVKDWERVVGIVREMQLRKMAPAQKVLELGLKTVVRQKHKSAAQLLVNEMDSCGVSIPPALAQAVAQLR
ncbi:unnamed protein product [Chrysoparadoxa australica]